MTVIPYDEIDPAIRELCRAVNEFPGIVTVESCQGFVDDHQPGEPWAVYFRPDPKGTPDPDGYASIEFLVWMMNSDARGSGFDVAVTVNAPPPALNGPTESLYFILECSNRHPDELAGIIRKRRDDFFVLAEH